MLATNTSRDDPRMIAGAMGTARISLADCPAELCLFMGFQPRTREEAGQTTGPACGVGGGAGLRGGHGSAALRSLALRMGMKKEREGGLGTDVWCSDVVELLVFDEGLGVD